MDEQVAKQLVKHTLQRPFNKPHFVYLVKNLLNHIDDFQHSMPITSTDGDFVQHISNAECIGKYQTPDNKSVDILIVYLKKNSSLDRARTKQRNYIAKYLNGSRGGVLKDAALVAFVAPNNQNWRFSLVKMEYTINEQGKVKEDLTPARRYSFLVGANENSHTAQSHLLPLLLNDETDPTLQELERAFSVERVAKEFFTKYRDLFLKTKEALEEIVTNNAKVRNDFTQHNINTADFAKKLLGQIVFLYFLQKKGWFGVARGAQWGDGSKNFLRELFNESHCTYKNFFNDILEPLFYEALRSYRTDDYYSRFDCQIPFLNGGLFDPIGDYGWVNADILLPNDLFSNKHITKESDIGDGILDIFDRYNFTVKEDEPLEKEVAVDPEMLGKVFENLLEVKDRKSKGTYYTPREIVHYMCQQSLINYLTTELAGTVSKPDIEKLIKHGESAVEQDSNVTSEQRETGRHKQCKLSERIHEHADLIDDKLATIRICDPAVGSGAFVVGMMNEIVRARSALKAHMAENDERTPYYFKQQAIKYCLYGVDIDPGAVEIAKLRLWLSLIVDEERRDTIKPLPNLDYKIIQGNSLLSIEKDLLNETLFDQLETLKLDYFEKTNAEEKQKYRTHIDAIISGITDGHKEFDFKVYFSEVFHEKQGFDVVIANPPYVDYRKIDAITKKAILAYEVAQHSSMINLYVYFFEKSLDILSENGVLTFISPQQYLILDNCQGLRNLLRKYCVDILADFARVKLFDAATYPFVSIILNGKQLRQGQYIEFDQVADLTNPARYLSIANPIPEPVNISDYQPLLLKIESSTRIKLGDVAKIFCASSTISLKSIVSSSAHFTLISSKDILRWKVKNPDRYIDKSNYSKESAKKQVGDTIFTTRMTARIRAVLIKDNKNLLGGKINVIKANDVHSSLLVALLNSKLINFWYRENYSMQHMQGGVLPFNTPELKKIPIVANSSVTDSVIIYVDKILAITKNDDYLENSAKQAKVKEYEKQIDQLVYQLYNLTDEEIKIIEGA